MLIFRLLLWLAAVVGCLVAGVGVLVLPASSMVGWAAVGIFTGILAANSRRQQSAAQPGSTPSAIDTGVLAGGAAVAGCFLFAGVTAVFGPVFAAALTLVGAAIACLLLWIRRQPTSAAGQSKLDGAPDSVCEPTPFDAAPPDALSDEQLYLVWQQSFLALQAARSGPERDTIVAFRASCLDELEQRDPRGFDRWLETGARAAGDPGKLNGTDG